MERIGVGYSRALWGLFDGALLQPRSPYNEAVSVAPVHAPAFLIAYSGGARADETGLCEVGSDVSIRVPVIREYRASTLRKAPNRIISTETPSGEGLGEGSLF